MALAVIGLLVMLCGGVALSAAHATADDPSVALSHACPPFLGSEGVYRISVVNLTAADVQGHVRVDFANTAVIFLEPATTVPASSSVHFELMGTGFTGSPEDAVVTFIESSPGAGTQATDTLDCFEPTDNLFRRVITGDVLPEGAQLIRNAQECTGDLPATGPTPAFFYVDEFSTRLAMADAECTFDFEPFVSDDLGPPWGPGPVTITYSCAADGGAVCVADNTVQFGVSGMGTITATVVLGDAEPPPTTVPAPTTTVPTPETTVATTTTTVAPQSATGTIDKTELSPGDELSVTGSGFIPGRGEQVEVWIHSDPILLTTVIAGSTGTASRKMSSGLRQSLVICFV